MNRRLTPDELAKANEFLHEIRDRLDVLSGGDANLRFAYNRMVYIRLTYDERGNPVQRRKLKDQKWKEQGGMCADCGHPLPVTGAVLDRKDAMLGYIATNTRVIHADCDYKAQKEKGYS
ncbi:MAG: hypothetical protein ACYDAG_15015 [Chloroflexota bacterium]